jgi:hypothetical protein
MHTLRVLGERPISVPASTFNVWVIKRIEEGHVGNGYCGEQILYIDTATGV